MIYHKIKFSNDNSKLRKLKNKTYLTHSQPSASKNKNK